MYFDKELKLHNYGQIFAVTKVSPTCIVLSTHWYGFRSTNLISCLRFTNQFFSNELHINSQFFSVHFATGQRECWTSNLSWYSLMAWCTCPRNETLVHQQLSLYQLHHCHPSATPEAISPLSWHHTFTILCIKSLLRVLSALLCFGVTLSIKQVKACDVAIHDW